MTKPFDDTFFSADGHLIEPADLWTTRLDRRFRDRAPHVEHGEKCDFVAVAKYGDFAAGPWNVTPLPNSSKRSGSPITTMCGRPWVPYRARFERGWKWSLTVDSDVCQRMDKRWVSARWSRRQNQAALSAVPACRRALHVPWPCRPRHDGRAPRAGRPGASPGTAVPAPIQARATQGTAARRSLWRHCPGSERARNSRNGIALHRKPPSRTA